MKLEHLRERARHRTPSAANILGTNYCAGMCTYEVIPVSTRYLLVDPCIVRKHQIIITKLLSRQAGPGLGHTLPQLLVAKVMRTLRILYLTDSLKPCPVHIPAVSISRLEGHDSSAIGGQTTTTSVN